MMECTDKHTSSTLMSANEALKIIANKRVVSCNPLEPIQDLYEVNKRPRTVVYNRPVQSAFSTLGLSKLHMLQFIAYLRKCLDRNKYACCFSDTDSCYMALSESCIDKCVRPEMKEYYESTKHNWFVSGDVFTKREPGKYGRDTVHIFWQQLLPYTY